jgi:kumamolisin
MTTSSKKVPLKGTRRIALKTAIVAGEIDHNERIEVTIVLHPSVHLMSEVKEMSKIHHGKRKYLTHDEFEKKYGALQDDLDKVRNFARENGLEVKEVNKAGRTVRLAGSIGSMSNAFGVKLKRYKHGEGSYRGREGEIFIPDNLKDIILAVQGLDNRPVAKPHFRRTNRQAKPRLGNRVSYNPSDLISVYNIPTGIDVSAHTIGLIELVGDGQTSPLAGYNSRDIQSYFQNIGVPAPNLRDVSVDGARNSPNGATLSDGTTNGDGEVELDIEVAGGIAPGVNIVVYFAPNTDDGFTDAFNVAINGDANGQNSLPPGSVLSVSWGEPEALQTDASKTAQDNLFQAAATKGITICVAAGDNGSSDGGSSYNVNPRLPTFNVDFPASSPNVLACGGTSLPQKNTTSEVVWNDGPAPAGATGGGISEFFAKPTYQANANIPSSPNIQFNGRGVPDVAADADPATGYNVFVDGASDQYGGTSAVAPLYAGLLTLINKILGHAVGFINPTIYGSSTVQQAFHDITSGNNNQNGGTLFTASPGWNACTGWGSPNGAALVTALQ